MADRPIRERDRVRQVFVARLHRKVALLNCPRVEALRRDIAQEPAAGALARLRHLSSRCSKQGGPAMRIKRTTQNSRVPASGDPLASLENV
jgi:hypothetical protein